MCHFSWPSFRETRITVSRPDAAGVIFIILFNACFLVCFGRETLKIQSSLIQVWGRGSVVGIAIRCGLEFRGSKPGGGKRFCLIRTRQDRRWGAPILPYHGYRFSLHGIKAPGRGPDQPSPSSAEFRMNTAVSILSVFAAWHVMGRPLPYLQISRWSLSLQNDPVFEKFLQHVCCCAGFKIRGLSEINRPFREV